MKVKSIFLMLLALGLNYCITANINQPPSVVEKTYPSAVFMNKSPDNTTNPYLGESNLRSTSEEDFFEEISKQDPAIKDNCKNCTSNNPPGYTEQIEPPKENQNQENTEVVIVNQQNPTIPLENQIGIASWYGKDFDGRPTASGELFDSRKLTAAHRTLPLGTMVSVKNLENNKEVILKINDRGPYVKDRILDVSEYAAEILGFKQKGLAKVEIKVLKQGDLQEKGEGATAFFFKKAQGEVGSSPYEEMIESKKQKIMQEILPLKDFKHYSVQIGRFTDIRNIVRLKEELEKKLPYPIVILQNNQEYILRIGKFSERYPAEVLKQKLEQEGYSGFVAIPN